MEELNLIRRVLFSIAMLSTLNAVSGADPFESFIFRFNCYRSEQPGCNTELIDAYPELAWSYTNLTKARTYFFLFTNDNPDEPERLHKCGGQVPPETKFNSKCKIRILVPGFASGVCNFAIYRELKNELLKSGCVNVILIDWMWGNVPDLIEAENNFPIVAGHIAIVIDNLKAKYNLTARNFQLICHSYGAHICGIVGQMTDICCIIGLDPSGIVQSEQTPLDKRLDPEDAPCVQAIHTSGGQCFPGFFGVNFTIGTTDFWVNGGLFNPSCALPTLRAFLTGDYIFGIYSLFPAACSHFQSLQFYKASINPTGCQFVGVKCDSLEDAKSGNCPRSCEPNGKNCAVMGEYGCDYFLQEEESNLPRGNYYLKTEFLCPYCDNSWLDLDGFSSNAAEGVNNL